MVPRGFRLASRAVSHEGGERRASLAGSGGEFMDYRSYEPGDEPRHVDWNVYARSGRLFTRQYRAERAARVYLALDSSGSMSGTKLEGARGVARFLRSFARSDAWRERSFPGLAAGLPPLALEKPGLVLLVSDGLEPLAPVRDGLLGLARRGFDLSFVQVLSADDLDPPPGPWRVRDAEGAGEREVGDRARRAYLERLERHLEALAATLRGLGFRHARLRDDAARAEAWARLRRAGILERGA